MASIVSRGNGKYAVIYYEGRGESRKQVWKSGLTMNEALSLKEKKNMEAKQRKAEERARRIGNLSPSKISVEDYMTQFIETYGARHWGSSYYSGNVSLLNNYIIPYLGHHKLSSVTTFMIDDYYDYLLNECEPVFCPGKQKRSNISPAQTKTIHKLLKTAFNQAKRRGLISNNPICDADAPVHKTVERPAFSPQELEKILAYTDEPDDYEKYTIHVALCIQYYCTTRGGEVSALQWGDLDIACKTLHIFKTIARIKKEYLKLLKIKIFHTFPDQTIDATTTVVLKSPKTAATERMCKINDLLIMKLERLKAMQQEMLTNIFCNHYYDNQLIICQPNGRPFMPEQLNRKFKKVILEMCEAGVKFASVPANRLNEVVFHSVRAASATKKLALSGGNIKAVMAAGGWTDPEMVIRYSKTYDEDQEYIVQKMENDYLKTTQPSADPEKEKLLSYIVENPEVINEILKAFLSEAVSSPKYHHK